MNDTEQIERAKLFEFIREMGVRLDDNTRVLKDVLATLEDVRRDHFRVKKNRNALKKKVKDLGANTRNVSPTWRNRLAWHYYKSICSKTKRRQED